MDDKTEPQEPLFRPSKRRKIFRKRQIKDGSADESTVLQTQSLGQHEKGDTPGYEADGAEEIARIEPHIRHIKHVGTKRGGVGFSSSGKQKVTGDKLDIEQSQAIVPAQNNASDITSTRFMAPTGQVVSSDDKHMMAYIDSRLARIPSRNARDDASLAIDESSMTPSGLSAAQSSTSSPEQSTRTTTTTQQQGTSGHPETSRTNAQAPAQRNPKPKPPRLGRDGKPLRPRKDRHRRTSFDIARDAMVEQVLRESRLDIYDESAGQVASANLGAGMDEDADERMAAEFRRNFIAAQEERTVRKPPPPPPGAKGDPVKGPKLGGSRSQRAAMRAMEEQAAAKGKK